MQKNDERFRIFIQNVLKKDSKAVRMAIIRGCKITESSYYNWIKGIATPSLKRREVINGIAFKFNYPIVYQYAKGYKEKKKRKLSNGNK